MPLILSHENTKDMSDADLLLMCVKEYADPSNYEPYEKDYGTGRPVMRIPMIARGKGDYARMVLQHIEDRKKEREPCAAASATAS